MYHQRTNKLWVSKSKTIERLDKLSAEIVDLTASLEFAHTKKKKKKKKNLRGTTLRRK